MQREIHMTGSELLALIKDDKHPKIVKGTDGFDYLWDTGKQTYMLEGTNIAIAAYDLATCSFRYGVPILDDIEKRYLRGVIRPFRGRVDMIQKIKSSIDGFEHIKMYVSYPGSSALQSSLMLPAFESGTMYTGMECMRQYTVSELEL